MLPVIDTHNHPRTPPGVLCCRGESLVVAGIQKDGVVLQRRRPACNTTPDQLPRVAGGAPALQSRGIDHASQAAESRMSRGDPRWQPVSKWMEWSCSACAPPATPRPTGSLVLQAGRLRYKAGALIRRRRLRNCGCVGAIPGSRRYPNGWSGPVAQAPRLQHLARPAPSCCRRSACATWPGH